MIDNENIQEIIWPQNFGGAECIENWRQANANRPWYLLLSLQGDFKKNGPECWWLDLYVYVYIYNIRMCTLYIYIHLHMYTIYTVYVCIYIDYTYVWIHMYRYRYTSIYIYTLRGTKHGKLGYPPLGLLDGRWSSPDSLIIPLWFHWIFRVSNENLF